MTVSRSTTTKTFSKWQMEKEKIKKTFYTPAEPLDQTIMIASVRHHHIIMVVVGFRVRIVVVCRTYFLIHKHFFQFLPQLFHSAHKTTPRSHMSSVISPRICRRILNILFIIIVHVLCWNHRFSEPESLFRCCSSSMGGSNTWRRRSG